MSKILAFNTQVAYSLLVAAILAGADDWGADLTTGQVLREGRPTGSLAGNGRYYIDAFGRKLLRSRVIAGVAVGYAISRTFEVDHLNGDTADDRAANLEPITPAEHRARSTSRPRNVIADGMREAIVDALRSGRPKAQVRREFGLPLRTVQHIAAKAA